MEYLIGDNNPNKYNYKFKEKNQINRSEYCTIWVTGMMFQSTKEFMEYLNGKSECCPMIKTARGQCH